MSEEKLHCPFENCIHKFSRKWNLDRHIERVHSNNLFSESCLLCGKFFTESEKLQIHLILDHTPSTKFVEKESAFEKTIQTYRFVFDDNHVNFNEGQTSIRKEIIETVRFEAAKRTVIKVSLVFICQMSMLDLATNEKIQSSLIPFRANTFMTNALRKNGLTKKVQHSFNEQNNAMEEFCDSSSKWVFDRCVAFDIEISGLKAVAIGNYSSSSESSESEDESLKISLKNLNNEKALFNPSNRDQECFLRCIYYALYKKKKKLVYEKWKLGLDLDGLIFPITIPNIKRFVKKNKQLNLRINILYRCISGMIFPFECGIGHGLKTVNLLMINKPVSKQNEFYSSDGHFLVIKNLSKFLKQKYQTEGKKHSYERSYYCVNCLNKFTTKKGLKRHEELCLDHKPVREICYKTNISFNSFAKQHWMDYIGFLDFECTLTPDTTRCNECSSLRCKCDKSFSEIVNHQLPIAFSLLIINSKSEIVHEKTMTCPNAADKLIEHLLDLYEDWFEDMLDGDEPLDLSNDDIKRFQNTHNCYLCGLNFQDMNLIKCRDHNHYTGDFLGAACQRCNLNRRKQYQIPIFLHNGSRYDFHFIIKALKNKKVGQIKVLPYNGEHFRTISFRGYKFVDSLAFLQASLAQLAEDLSKTDHRYEVLRQTHLVKTSDSFDEKKFKLILGKSFFPYEYCTSFKKMRKTLSLPCQKDFYSKLSEKSISDKDYAFAKTVWDTFQCKNLLDYTQLYCKIDIVLLAEVFQKFRRDMHKFTDLDPAHYISLPALAFDAMLKQTKCELDTLSDINMVHFFENNIRGGVSFINTRHLEVKNDDEEIVYIDANVSV